MAIINNPLLEKTSGSVGNITYYLLNGQQIARSRNRNPYDPKTEAQLLQRAKMSNCVLAFKHLKVWLTFIKPMVVAPRSLYNQFTSMFTDLFPSIVLSTISEILNSLLGLSVGTSNYIIIEGFSKLGNVVTVTFNANGSSWSINSSLRIVSTSSTTGLLLMTVASIDEDSFNSGAFDFMLTDDYIENIGLYACTTDYIKCSNIKF